LGKRYHAGHVTTGFIGATQARPAVRHALFVCSLLVTSLLGGVASAVADDFFRPLDLRDAFAAESRFYISGIVGSSWATLTVDEPPSAVDPIFTAGGAAGWAFDREAGRLRFEIEGRGRDALGLAEADAEQSAAFRATDGWSALVNLWRDIDITDKLSLYAGGGIGGGGYRVALSSAVPAENFTVDGNSATGGFAWQAGGGVNYAVTDRITLDLGYRFFAIDGGSITATSRQDGVPVDTSRLSSAFSASELLLTVRIEEPFRRWR
jgi:opacity protein-like surface antigen